MSHDSKMYFSTRKCLTGTQGRNSDCLVENPLAGVEYFYLDKKYQVVLSYLEIYSSLVKNF